MLDLADRSIGSTYIEFDQVEVPVANLLGEENKGFPVIMNSKSLKPLSVLQSACLNEKILTQIRFQP